MLITSNDGQPEKNKKNKKQKTKTTTTHQMMDSTLFNSDK
jgi:hypothetical protein